MEDILYLVEEGVKSKTNYKIYKEVGLYILKLGAKVAMFSCLFVALMLQAQEVSKNRIVPVKITEVNQIEEDVKKVLTMLKCPDSMIERLVEPTILSARVANVDPILIAVLTATESEFSLTARSKMGYKGLMQTPTATKRPVVDMVHGCDVLKEKLMLAKGDVLLALTWYKGSSTTHVRGKETDGFKQAKHVLAQYKSIKERIRS